jgi:hypothetical protein
MVRAGARQPASSHRYRSLRELCWITHVVPRIVGGIPRRMSSLMPSWSCVASSHRSVDALPWSRRLQRAASPGSDATSASTSQPLANQSTGAVDACQHVLLGLSACRPHASSLLAQARSSRTRSRMCGWCCRQPGATACSCATHRSVASLRFRAPQMQQHRSVASCFRAARDAMVMSYDSGQLVNYERASAWLNDRRRWLGVWSAKWAS